MTEVTKVRAGQVWAPLDGIVPDIKVTGVSSDGKTAECQVIGRDRSFSVATKRLLSGQAGYGCRSDAKRTKPKAAKAA
jgi:hypothetical protein